MKGSQLFEDLGVGRVADRGKSMYESAKVETDRTDKKASVLEYNEQRVSMGQANFAGPCRPE